MKFGIDFGALAGETVNIGNEEYDVVDIMDVLSGHLPASSRQHWTDTVYVVKNVVAIRSSCTDAGCEHTPDGRIIYPVDALITDNDYWRD